MRVLGLMSGTSLDGIDVALIETDGEQQITPLSFASFPMPEELGMRIRRLIDRAWREQISWPSDPEVEQLRSDITAAHCDAISMFYRDHGQAALIGFHGQTVWHDPLAGLTVQLSDGAAMARQLQVPVIDQFRIDDVVAGGQGAPLAPLFHAALVPHDRLPAAVINIGGVANLTFLGSQGEILAFDTGPGNALINDWMLQQIGLPMDKGGEYAARGRVHDAIVNAWLEHAYFSAAPPKSLDRNQFDVTAALEGLSVEDGAATLTEFSLRSIAMALTHLGDQPTSSIICGGGRHNHWMMSRLSELLPGAVLSCEALGWDGDALEAQAFAWLAVRSLNGLVISLPETTGAPVPMSGGRLHRP